MNPFDLGWVPLMFSVSNVFFLNKANPSRCVGVAGPSFSIAIQSDDTSVYPSKTAKMKCSLSVSRSSQNTGTAHTYATQTYGCCLTHTLKPRWVTVSVFLSSSVCFFLFYTRIHTLSFTDFVLALLRSPPANLSAALIIGMMWLLHFKWFYR